ncbi:MAG: hypothetical protein QCI38_00460 [Candidatus Thermoplasmatota archaeon]|nr:hypothetical protein [Candidatus Thermoplasmatota archaeon]
MYPTGAEIRLVSLKHTTVFNNGRMSNNKPKKKKKQRRKHDA